MSLFKCSCCQALKDENKQLRSWIDQLLQRVAGTEPTIALPEAQIQSQEQDTQAGEDLEQKEPSKGVIRVGLGSDD